MYEIKPETLENAYKPFDVVRTNDGELGYISEVKVSQSQPDPKDQIQYSITHLSKDNEGKNAWWDHDDLTYQCNLFVEIAQNSVHPFGGNKYWVKKLLGF